MSLEIIRPSLGAKGRLGGYPGRLYYLRNYHSKGAVVKVPDAER